MSSASHHITCARSKKRHALAHVQIAEHAVEDHLGEHQRVAGAGDGVLAGAVAAGGMLLAFADLGMIWNVLDSCMSSLYAFARAPLM